MSRRREASRRLFVDIIDVSSTSKPKINISVLRKEALVATESGINIKDYLRDSIEITSKFIKTIGFDIPVETDYEIDYVFLSKFLNYLSITAIGKKFTMSKLVPAGEPTAEMEVPTLERHARTCIIKQFFNRQLGPRPNAAIPDIFRDLKALRYKKPRYFSNHRQLEYFTKYQHFYYNICSEIIDKAYVNFSRNRVISNEDIMRSTLHSIDTPGSSNQPLPDNCNQ